MSEMGRRPGGGGGGGGGRRPPGVPAPLTVIKDIDVLRRQRVFAQVKGNPMPAMTRAHALCAPCPPRAETWEVTRKVCLEGGNMARAEVLRLQDPRLPPPSTCAEVGRGHLDPAPRNTDGHAPGLAGRLAACLHLGVVPAAPRKVGWGSPQAALGPQPSLLPRVCGGGRGDLYSAPRRPAGGQGETPETQGLAKVRLIRCHSSGLSAQMSPSHKSPPDRPNSPEHGKPHHTRMFCFTQSACHYLELS